MNYKRSFCQLETLGKKIRMQTHTICSTLVAATLAFVALLEHDRSHNGEGGEKGGEDDGEAHVSSVSRPLISRF